VQPPQILGGLPRLQQVAGYLGPHAPVYGAEAGRQQLRREGQVPAAAGRAAYATAHRSSTTKATADVGEQLKLAHQAVRCHHLSSAQISKRKANSPAVEGAAMSAEGVLGTPSVRAPRLG
jgi:hypothetical protein